MISVLNASKKYKNHIAVNDVSFEVNEGSVCGLLGANGAGKTTLLKVIAGIYRTDSGSVKIKDQEVFENLDVKKDCFFMPDIPFSFPGYTVRQMANFYKSTYKNWSESHFKSLEVHFNISTDTKISSLSKGMQRQVSFWLAFSTKPKVLLLDEPMDGLDPVMRKQIREIVIREVASENLTVLISSHNLRELEDMCDAVVMMHKGACVLKRNTDDLSMSYQKVQVALSSEEEEIFIKMFNPFKIEKRGNIINCVIKDTDQEFQTKLETLNSTFVELVPLTLEEIFIYEMEKAGYVVE